jgi:hypothetical protein
LKPNPDSAAAVVLKSRNVEVFIIFLEYDNFIINDECVTILPLVVLLYI